MRANDGRKLDLATLDALRIRMVRAMEAGAQQPTAEPGVQSPRAAPRTMAPTSTSTESSPLTGGPVAQAPTKEELLTPEQVAKLDRLMDSSTPLEEVFSPTELAMLEPIKNPELRHEQEIAMRVEKAGVLRATLEELAATRRQLMQSLQGGVPDENHDEDHATVEPGQAHIHGRAASVGTGASGLIRTGGFLALIGGALHLVHALTTHPVTDWVFYAFYSLPVVVVAGAVQIQGRSSRRALGAGLVIGAFPAALWSFLQILPFSSSDRAYYSWPDWLVVIGLLLIVIGALIVVLSLRRTAGSRLAFDGLWPVKGSMNRRPVLVLIKVLAVIGACSLMPIVIGGIKEYGSDQYLAKYVWIALVFPVAALLIPFLSTESSPAALQRGLLLGWTLSGIGPFAVFAIFNVYSRSDPGSAIFGITLLGLLAAAFFLSRASSRS